MEKDDKRAVAVSYKEGLPAPFVVAKGKAHTAERICKLAEKFGINIVDDKEFVEDLYFLEIGQMIPEKLFVIMAEILAFVYSHEETEI